MKTDNNYSKGGGRSSSSNNNNNNNNKIQHGCIPTAYRAHKIKRIVTMQIDTNFHQNETNQYVHNLHHEYKHMFD